MKTEIRWKQGYRAKVEAEVAYEEMERIRKRNGGEATTPAIVRAAKPKASPLHDVFEWDDGVAAHCHRLYQARQMARSFVLVDVESGTEAPAYLNVAITNGEDESATRRAYVPTGVVIKTPELRRCAIQEALEGLLAWKRRHGMIAGFEPVTRAIERVQAKIERGGDREHDRGAARHG